MKKVLTLVFGLWLLTCNLQAQVFTFECTCAQLSPADLNCDICNTSILTRSFSGLLIYKNGVPFKWIDKPYTIRQLAGENVQFIEQIPTPDQITIARFQTQFATMADFVDSTNCLCNTGGGLSTIVRDSSLDGSGAPSWPLGIDNYAGATVGQVPSKSALGITWIAVDPSSTNELQTYAHTGTTSYTNTLSLGGGSFTLSASTGIGIAHSAGTVTFTNTGDLSNANELQNLSLTGQALGITSGSGVTLPIIGVAAGTGISVSISSGTATVTNTGDLSASNEIQSLSRNVAVNNIVTLSLSGGTANVEDLFAEGLATFTPGGTTATMSGTLPAENTKIWVTRNGLPYIIGTNVLRSGATLTFSRVLASGEVVRFKYPLQ